MIPVITKGAKTQEHGKFSISTTIRHKEAMLCSHNALAYHFFTRFTQMAEPFSDPRDAARWSTTPLWPGNDCTGNVSYCQQYDDVTAYFQKLGIKVNKVTHSWRVFGARLLDDMGVDDQVSLYLLPLHMLCLLPQQGCELFSLTDRNAALSSMLTLLQLICSRQGAPSKPFTFMIMILLSQVIARMGKWSCSAMKKSYLLNCKPQGLLAIAGWPHAAGNVKYQFFHERFCMTVPNTLVELLVFPFIRYLEQVKFSPAVSTLKISWT